MKGDYSDLWTRIGDFQTLIAALIGLAAVAGAIYAVRLQARLANLQTARATRDVRIRTAATIRSLISIERLFPETSYLRIPTKDQTHRMLAKGTGVELGTADYLGYLQTFATSLSEYPPPISDRANFLSWASGRVALAIRRAASSAPNASEAAIAAAAREVRFILVAAILVAEKLAAELGPYMRQPEVYEEWWRENPTAGRWSCGGPGEGFSSDAFDLDALEHEVRLAIVASEHPRGDAP